MAATQPYDSGTVGDRHISPGETCSIERMEQRLHLKFSGIVVMRSMLCLVGFLFSVFCTGQSMMQVVSKDSLLGELTCGEQVQGVKAMHQLHGTRVSVQVVQLDDLCSVIINPANLEDDQGQFVIAGLNGSCDLMPPIGMKAPVFSTPLPVTVWHTVSTISCSCPADRYARIAVYGQRLK